MSNTDPKLRFPATGRNRDAILAVLREVLPARGHVIEIACGSGEHITFFAPHFPEVSFLPTDYEAEHQRSVDAWSKELAVHNVNAARFLDASAPDWALPEPWRRSDAIFCGNMIHIAPFAATTGLMAGAGRHLRSEGALVLYGPFTREGRHTAPSNAQFDQSLRGRNPEWGVRDLDEVSELAKDAGLLLERVVEMPANNLSVIFRRS